MPDKAGFKTYTLFLFITVMAVSLAIGEFAARTFHLSETHERNRWDRRRTRGGIHYFAERNSHGWRDREFTERKEAGKFRIACIGDSVTAGYRVELEDTFSKALERMFRDTSHDVEVMNLGQDGNFTSDNLLALKTSMKFDPDLIIYQFGLNDIKEFEDTKTIPKEALTPTTSGLKPLLRKSVLWLTLAERYQYLKLKLAHKNWAFNEWDIPRRFWQEEFIKLKREFAEIRDSSKILIIYVPYGHQVHSDREEVFGPSEKISKFCRDNAYYFLDFLPIFKSQKKRGLFEDASHPSRRGHKIIAEHIRDFILHRIVK